MDVFSLEEEECSDMFIMQSSPKKVISKEISVF